MKLYHKRNNLLLQLSTIRVQKYKKHISLTKIDSKSFDF